MQVQLAHKNGEVFTASHGDNSVLLGRGDCFRPMEMVLASIASCASIDILMILEKQRLSFDNYGVLVDGIRDEENIPSVFTDITLEFQFKGDNLPKAKLERAILLSIEKYCSVSAMLNQNVKIHLKLTINENSYEI